MENFHTTISDDFVFYLLLLEIAVGIMQLFGALIRTIICFETKQPIGKLKIYWIIVVIYFLVFYGLYFFKQLDLIISMLILAWCIAIWYCINIVFAKRKNITEINNSLTQ